MIAISKPPKLQSAQAWQITFEYPIQIRSESTQTEQNVQQAAPQQTPTPKTGKNETGTTNQVSRDEKQRLTLSFSDT